MRLRGSGWGWVAVVCLLAARTAQGGFLPPGTAIGSWSFVDSKNGKVRVWWNEAHPEDKAIAEFAGSEIDRYLWDKLTNAKGMGREPLSDKLAPSNGDNGRLDIVLTAPGVERVQGVIQGIERGLTIPSPGVDGHKPHSVFINIDRGLTINQLQAVLAHEMMHAIIASYNVNFADYGWLDEATGKWAEHFAYRDNNSEHDAAKDFFASPAKSLDQAAGFLEDYTKYVYLLYLQESSLDPNDAAPVRAIWQQADGTGKKPRKAMDAALSAKGGFDKEWIHFLEHNWNAPPYSAQKPSYLQWDKLTYGVAERQAFGLIEADLQGKETADYPLEARVAPLAGAYFDVVFKDPKVRSVRLVQGLKNLPEANTIKLAVFTKIKGEPDWKIEENWMETWQHPFCLDIQKERLEEMVVIIGNTNLETLITPADLRGINAPTVTVSDAGCWKIAGQVTAVTKDSHATTTVKTKMVFTATAPGSPEAGAFDAQGTFNGRFHLESASANWTHVGAENGCTANASGHFSVVPTSTYGEINMLGINPYYTSEPAARKYTASVIADVVMTPMRVKYVCPPGRGPVTKIISPVLWLTPNPTATRVGAGGKLEGSQSAGSESFTWSFAPQSEQ